MNTFADNDRHYRELERQEAHGASWKPRTPIARRPTLRRTFLALMALEVAVIGSALAIAGIWGLL